MLRYFFRHILVASGTLLASSLITATASPFDTLTVAETDASLASYQEVYLAPVKVSLSPDTRRNVRDISSPRPVTENDQATRARKLHKSLTRAFGRHFTIVDTPGVNVLTIETTLTRLESTRPTLGDARTNPQIDFGSSIYAGGAEFEVRLANGETLIAEISDNYQTRLNDGRPRIGTWQDADRANRSFSTKLARYVSRN